MYKIDDISYVISKLGHDSRFEFDPGSENTFFWNKPVDDDRTRYIETNIGIRVYGTTSPVDI